MYSICHASVGGVTDYFGKFKIVVHKDSKVAFSLDPSNFPTYPSSDLGSVLECKVRGVEVAATRLPRLPTPAVKRLDHGACFTWRLIGIKKFNNTMFSRHDCNDLCL